MSTGEQDYSTGMNTPKPQGEPSRIVINAKRGYYHKYKEIAPYIQMLEAQLAAKDKLIKELMEALGYLMPLFEDLEENHTDLLPFGKATFNYEKKLLTRAKAQVEGKESV